MKKDIFEKVLDLGTHYQLRDSRILNVVPVESSGMAGEPCTNVYFSIGNDFVTFAEAEKEMEIGDAFELRNFIMEVEAENLASAINYTI